MIKIITDVLNLMNSIILAIKNLASVSKDNNINKKSSSKDKTYIINKIDEIDKVYSDEETQDDYLRLSLLKIFKKVLAVREICLYKNNIEDKKIIDLKFKKYTNGVSGTVSAMRVTGTETGVVFTIDDAKFKNKNNIKIAKEHIAIKIKLYEDILNEN